MLNCCCISPFKACVNYCNPQIIFDYIAAQAEDFTLYVQGIGGVEVYSLTVNLGIGERLEFQTQHVFNSDFEHTFVVFDSSGNQVIFEDANSDVFDCLKIKTVNTSFKSSISLNLSPQ